MLSDWRDDIIYPEAIDKRIAFLEGAKIQGIPEWDEDFEDELGGLKQFRQDVHDTISEDAWTNSPGFIADAYFSRYAFDFASEMYSITVVELPYWDQDAFEDDYREKFQEIDLDGVTYLIDNGC